MCYQTRLSSHGSEPEKTAVFAPFHFFRKAQLASALPDTGGEIQEIVFEFSALSSHAKEQQIHTLTSDQTRLPAEFKHINKRRKRN
jgi:hypothetical protein